MTSGLYIAVNRKEKTIWLLSSSPGFAPRSHCRFPDEPCKAKLTHFLHSELPTRDTIASYEPHGRRHLQPSRSCKSAWVAVLRSCISISGFGEFLLRCILDSWVSSFVLVVASTLGSVPSFRMDRPSGRFGQWLFRQLHCIQCGDCTLQSRGKSACQFAKAWVPFLGFWHSCHACRVLTACLVFLHGGIAIVGWIWMLLRRQDPNPHAQWTSQLIRVFCLGA